MSRCLQQVIIRYDSSMWLQPIPLCLFFDSVQCIVQLSSVPVDTVVLSQYDLSDFYEAPLGTSFRMKVYNAETLDIIDNTTTTLNSAGFNDFNTAALFGAAPGGVAYNFTLQKIY